MLKINLLVVVCIFSCLSVKAEVGTRGGERQTNLSLGDVALCVKDQKSYELATMVQCKTEHCDAEKLCTELGLVLAM